MARVWHTPGPGFCARSELGHDSRTRNTSRISLASTSGTWALLWPVHVDAHVQSEMLLEHRLQLLALDDLDPSVTHHEVVAGLTGPRGRDQDALRGSLVLHHAGKGAQGLRADCLPV